jgi:hypothetical protein
MSTTDKPYYFCLGRKARRNGHPLENVSDNDFNQAAYAEGWQAMDAKIQEDAEKKVRDAMNKRPNVSAIDIAREYFPGLSDQELLNIMWGKTGFPAFWNIPKDGNTPEECFRKQLADWKQHLADPKG